MGEKQSSKASKAEEEREIKEEKADEPFLLSSISLPNRSSTEAVLEKGSSHRSISETLTLATPLPVGGNERDSSDYQRFSQLLAGAMVSPEPAVVNSVAAGMEKKPMPVLTLSVDSSSQYSAAARPSLPSGFQGQFGMSHQEALASVTAQAQMKLQAAQPSSSSGSLNALIPSVFSAFNPIPQQQRAQPTLEDNFSTPEIEQHPSCDQKSQSTLVVAKTPSGDGYNWRKYGEKQVKGIACSRSYYRCSHADCHVRKKVVRCYSGRVIEIIYEGQHNHDPPQNNRRTKESRIPSGGPFVERETANLPCEKLNASNSPEPWREQPSSLATCEQQSHYSNDCHGGAGIRVNEYDDEPQQKRRITYSTPPLKTARVPKVVVQTASDPGMLGDGYKWRKYGQKIVKGNPNPRSYYKCSYDGCSVRKHVERASDDAKSLVITYDGEHNHEQPSSNNSVVSNGTTLLISAAAAITAGEQPLTTSDLLPVQEPTAQFPSDTEDEVSEKALESAQTLLSIGFNSNSREAEGAAKKNPNVMEQPLLNGNHAAVPV